MDGWAQLGWDGLERSSDVLARELCLRSWVCFLERGLTRKDLRVVLVNELWYNITKTDCLLLL